ncbi:uncharacterized protein RB166_006034 [Leptodactylus fuscus]|uniref:uncharacterized protein LOC142200277 n=1 Tax=Leptodactylus fuscus TaxID=238119 RepID=UPI003F4F3069
MKQMFSFSEMENETMQHRNDLEDQCSKEEQTLTGNADSNEASLKQNEIDETNEENFGMLETTHMEMLHKNTVYDKGVKTSERSNYMSFTELSKRERPNSAGKQKFQQEQFQFKQIKRSMSASITVSEQTPLQEELKHSDIELSDREGLDTVNQENEIAQMVDIPSEIHKTIDYTSAISGQKVEKNSENDTGISNDNYSTTSSLGPKKKKKKNNPKKNLQTSIPKENTNCLDFPQVEHGKFGEEQNSTAKNIVFEEIFPPHIHSNSSELSTTRRLKGNKQMAKVKPRSLKTNDELVHDSNQNAENTEDTKVSAEHISKKNVADYSNGIASNEAVLYDNRQTQCPLMESKPVPEEIIPKKNSRAKSSQKKSKKQKSLNKKKNSIGTESKATNGSDGLDGLDSEINSSPTLQNALESYVQSWLKNIFPNVAFPVLQPYLITKLEEEATNSVRNSSNGSSQPYVEIKNLGGEVRGNANGCQNKPTLENQVGYTSSIEEKEIPIQHVQPFDEEVVSSFMEKSKYLAELFAQQFNDFGCDVVTENREDKEVIMRMGDFPKKPSSDAAVQVENNNSDCGLMEKLLSEEFGMSPKTIPSSKCRRLEKSISLPNSPSRPESSSPQVLLAWLIVLHLKQSMSHIVENVSSKSNNSSAIFTLLQSLKKIAITEKADDLKAIVLSLQESALSSNSPTRSIASVKEPAPSHEFPMNQPNSTERYTECITESNHNIPSIKETWEISDAIKNEDLNDDIDDFRFFATQPYRELSGEFSQNENDRNLEEHSLSEYQYSLQNAATDLLERTELIPNNKQMIEEHPLDRSPRHSPSLMSNYNVDDIVGAHPMSSPKISRVKMMVQEMEQRKFSSQYCEQQKCLQSPISSDWSDYRQDSEESLSDTLRASSEIMTESGEEQIHEKPLKTGYVRRAIERLYGKAESIIRPSKSPNNISSSKKCHNNGNNEYLTFSSQDQQSVSKENLTRSISSPSNKSMKVGSLKSASLPMLDAAGDHDGEICQKPGSSQSNKSHKHKDGHKGMSINNGVLIDKGRWLLKENHLLRRSPPEATGMYVNLDTTSADTLLDTTSDDIPYMHSACRVNQPIAEISSSEIEDLAKPHHYTCNYFNMPHGSDSEPFNDTLSTRSKVRPKSSGAVVKSKTHDAISLESIEKCGGISASLPSFATVDFHMSDNKVHPLQEPDADETRNDQSPNTSRRSQGQVREQDSLDKLQFICGQHCPILSAIILPVNEGDRGFAYCSPYDIENLLYLQPLSINTLDTALLNDCTHMDENNNIQYYKKRGPGNTCCDSEVITFDDRCKNLKTYNNLKKSSDCLSELYPNIANKIARLINLYKDIHSDNMYQALTCMGNDENNNVLLYHTTSKSNLTLC